MKRLIQYIAPYKYRMSAGLAIKIVGTVMDLFLPMILSHIIDNIIPTKEVDRIWYWGIIMMICSVIAVVGNIVANRMASRVAGDCVKSIRHDLFAKISYMDAETVDDLTVSSLESRITSDTYTVHHMLAMVQRMGVRAPILAVGGICVAFALDARLTVIMILTMPFIFATTFIISGKGVKLYKKLHDAADEIVSVVRENATGVRVIKALCKTEYEKKRFDKVNTNAIAAEKKAGTVTALSGPLVALFLNIGLCAVIAAGAYYVDSGLSTNGKIIAFMSYFTIISNATISLSRIFTVASRGMACMQRIDKVLSEEPKLWLDMYEEFDAVENNDENIPHISFNNVTFSYGTKKDVLKNISFELKKGETLGIIGGTGSGKSTLISLLMRMYDVTEGEILIDGTDIRKIPSSVLRQKFGAVFQNDFLFADSIYENVCFGRDISKEDVDKALEMAQAKFVKNYDDGKYHELDIKGANLSGGQKQRLLVARAFADNPEILILDDSSSALDYKTDAELRKIIRTSFKDSSVIIIAQRISAVMHSDKILVLDAGEAAGFGKHSELLEKCDIYKEIYDVQMSGGAVIE